MNYLGYVAAVLTTISFLPQLINVIKTKSTKDISLAMYIVFVVGVICWATYGLLVKDISIIAANFATLAFAGVILVFKIINTINGKDKKAKEEDKRIKEAVKEQEAKKEA